MKIEFFPPDSVTEPRHWVRHDQAFAMMLGTGSIEWGSKRSLLEKFDYAPGNLAICERHIERAKTMLRGPDARVLDVAVACGFKTQQHFAQVFRDVCKVSPTEFRQNFLGSEDTPQLVIPDSGPERRLPDLPFTSLLTPSPVRNL